MPTKWDLDNVKLSLYNSETGENLGELDGINEINLDVNTKYETKYDKDNHTYNSLLSCGDCTMEFSCDITDINFDELFGIDKANKPDAYDITYVKIVQCRKHKRKRINKKWAKIYGYKQVNVTSKGWQLNTYTDGTFEFKKDIK
jgi:hypothetical protein